MEFISSKEFLSMTIEMQKVLRDWWKPSVADIYIDISPNNKQIISVIEDEADSINIDAVKESIVPLLTEWHLRKFIEDKKDWKVSVINTGSKYRLVLEKLKSNLFHEKMDIFTHTGASIFEAYKKVVWTIIEYDMGGNE